ncbi:MAG: AbrB/MazE/SpoVT family DNA-binding domain-containing protein [Caulobacter sp.]
MHVGKRGKDLAVRIPVAVVKAMNLKPGDEVDLKVLGPREFQLVRKPAIEAPLEETTNETPT